MKTPEAASLCNPENTLKSVESLQELQAAEFIAEHICTSQSMAGTTTDTLKQLAAESKRRSDEFVVKLEKDTGKKFIDANEKEDWNKAPALIFKGQKLAAKHNLDQAAKCFETAVVYMKRSQIDPVATPLAYTGIIKEAQNDLRTAETCMISAIARGEHVIDGKINIFDTPEVSAQLAVLSRIESKLGNKEKAEEYLDCAVTLYPQGADKLKRISSPQ